MRPKRSKLLVRGGRRAFWPAAQAQDYPNKPVTFITPAAAGNSPDVVTRIVADKLTQLWKQQIVVHQPPGAGG
jgi:tripartite-type tricarboxylate transporter receptor subunit TctC